MTRGSERAYIGRMNFTNSLLPDYSTFTINDFELRYGALSAVVNTASNYLCQPRATTPDGQISAGGALVEAEIIEPNMKRLDEMMDALKNVVLSDPDDDARRHILLIRHETEFGEGDPNRIIHIAWGFATRGSEAA